MPTKKSVIWAYLLWLFGGLFGLHHFYLRRDRHGFVWWTTLGGFGIGWLGEVFRIPRYVRDANEDPKHMEELINKMLRNKKPPFSMNRFTGMLMVGYSWGQMMMLAVPPDGFWGINLRYLNLLIPLAAALGVWTVGNIGREKGSLKWPLIAAYAAYPIRYYIYDESVWFSLMVLASTLAFDSLSKEWKRTPKNQRLAKRIIILAVCASLYIALWCSYIYFYGTVTDSEGDEVPIYEALHHFYTSPWWLDVKQCLVDTYKYAQHHGWYEVWKQVIDLSDPHGEQNAYKLKLFKCVGYKVHHRYSTLVLLSHDSLRQLREIGHKIEKTGTVLGIGPDASQQEITIIWRKLSRENHPDKVKDESSRKVAQERFMEIQQAYEILSNSKHRRNRRNKKDNSEPKKVVVDM